MKFVPGELSLEARLFTRFNLATIIVLLFCIAIALALTVVFNSPTANIILILATLVMLPLSMGAYRLARQDKVQRAITLTVAVWYVLALCMIMVGNRLYSILLVASIMPVMIVMPFVTPDRLQRFIAICLFFVISGSIAAMFPPLITPTVPDQLVFYVDAGMSVLLVFVVMLAVWQSGGRLAAAADGMRKAIAKLQVSERSLESKVEERTAKLEKAFGRISDINEITNIVNSTLDVNKVKDTIYHGLKKMFNFERMGIFLIDPDDQRLRLELEAGVPFADELRQVLKQDGLPLDAKDSFVAASVINKKSVYRQSVTPEGLAQAGDTDLFIYRFSPPKSFLICPLLLEHRAIGCIYFVAIEEPFVLEEEDIDSIEHYVNQMSTAIRNSRLFQVAEESRQEAETANETKGSFLANMSHEIRTPMNAIIGLTGLCLDTELDKKQEDYLNKVNVAANSLRTIIDDILDFSKLEAGKLEFEKIPFSLNDVLENLATICMVRCQSKQLELIFQRDPGLPDTLRGDPTRLGQILINLVGNAIKFTEEGQIVVEVRQTQRNKDRVTVHFGVRDSGIGMDKEQLSRLFQSFSQADSSISRQYGGTGLGLAISQQLTEMMGGHIEVSSELGIGSSFRFTLEFESVDIEIKTTGQEDAPKNLNVLVVDDNETMREILQVYLESFGYTVTLAESGKQALDILQLKHSFDLVLLDWMMPGMNGRDVALAIRELKARPKVILLSSWNLHSREYQSIVDAFLPKPVNPSSLLDTIMLTYGKQVTRRTRHIGTNTIAEDLVPISGARVLVVDDSNINLQIACELLQKVPLITDTACNGEEAVAKVKSNDYECVLMDIQMPVMDGYTATGLIREIFSFDQLPIVAMTANVMAEDKALANKSGMNGHVAKPIDPSELYKALADNIPEADYSKNLTTKSEREGVESSDVERAPLPNFLPGLDIKQGLARLANNETLYVKLLQDLFHDYADCPATLQQLVNQGEQDEIASLTHKLRGIASNLGAIEVGSVAESIEIAIHNGKTGELEQILKRLETALSISAESLSVLQQFTTPAKAAAPPKDLNTPQLFSDLNAAINASDPNSLVILDQLLVIEKDNIDIVKLLNASQKHLDNFNFTDAQHLLAKAEAKWGEIRH